MTHLEPALGDLGERKIVGELLADRYATAAPRFGDDCAWLPETGVVATTDPAPQPAVWALRPADWFEWGWLLVALNLSDVAASGADPIGVLTSLTLPSDTPVRMFERLLDGIDECCALGGTHVIGGNIKEDAYARAEAVALGRVSTGRPLSRRGARPDDVLLALGDTGLFWAALLTLEKGFVSTDPTSDARLEAALARPTPRLEAGAWLRRGGLARSCTDASDGLYAAVAGLTTVQGLGARLDFDEMVLDDLVVLSATRLGVDVRRLVLGFGDLQLVCAVAPADVDAVFAYASESDTGCVRLGVVTDGTQITANVNGFGAVLADFDNERFSSGSQFTAGLNGYRARLLDGPLTL